MSGKFGNRLKKLREKAGLTQEELAKRLGVSRNTYSNYEHGRGKPDIEILEKLRNEISVSADYLITGVGEVPKIQDIFPGLPSDSSGIEEMLEYMAKVPYVRYAIMTKFHELKMNHPVIFGESEVHEKK